MYKAVNNNPNFPELEEELLKIWAEEDTFRESVNNRKGAEAFIFYDGPPFATGLPHFGHILVGTVKDVILRYQTMQGHFVERRFGWDCHGLPVEYEMEKELGISGKKQIIDYGIGKFNEACRSIVQRYVKEWREVVQRSGRWVDFENQYLTMDSSYMESIWWVVKSLWEKKLIYKGHYILPYCPRCSTSLSNHELNLGGYKDVYDPAISVKFKLLGAPNTFMLAWTTTPWTLPANQALAVGADIEYAKVAYLSEDGKEIFLILAKARLAAYFAPEELNIIDEFKGSALVGELYEPLLPFFADLAEHGAFQVFAAEHVTTTDGSGVVHIAGAFGEDDYKIITNAGIPVVLPIDDECQFTAEVPDWEGLFVKDADKAIIRRLKQEAKLFKHEQYMHSYPHCWRCEAPLIYRAISSWFVDITNIKERILAVNQEIYWMPSHLKTGRFGKWLANAKDWAISRNRFWGNPLPIWECPNGHSLCVGSQEELLELSGQKVEDLHKHFVDAVRIECPDCSLSMQRIPEVLDCWFESGAMPYAQNHYPFENKEQFESQFPANFINESLDQTRGWFYTLVVLAAALFDKPPFKNVVVSGMILANDGKKMSKSARNYTDPAELMNSMGADAMRLYMMSTAVVRGEPIRFSDAGVKNTLKTIIIPLWNAYSFYVTYANIDAVQEGTIVEHTMNNPLDVWILSELESLIANVHKAMLAYDLPKAVEPILRFMELLNNWYIRRSRRRFWKSENDVDKLEAYQSLWTILIKLCQIAAPFIPFITDNIYRNLRAADMPKSVHLCDFPSVNEALRDLGLEQKMDLARKTVSMGRSLRAIHNIKNRQPLQNLYLVTSTTKKKVFLHQMQDLIREELNVKEVLIRADEEELVEYQAKANFKVLGKQLGPDMKLAAAYIGQLSSEEVASILNGSILSLDIGGKVHKTIELDISNIEVLRKEREGLKVVNEADLTLALDVEISPELYMEGLMRDLIRSIQNTRKDLDLEVTQRIQLEFYGSAKLRESLELFTEQLQEETLCVNWIWQENTKGQVQQIIGNNEQVVYTIKIYSAK